MTIKIPKTNILIEFRLPWLWLISFKDLILIELKINGDDCFFNFDIIIFNFILIGTYCDKYKFNFELLGCLFAIWFNQKEDNYEKIC
jgi:hypothetical protein